MCGEASVSALNERSALGPSPRVRGSLHERQVHVVGPGSIPACAGKPSPGSFGSGSFGVHPRVCGEALHHSLKGRETIGSIPACAGKPCSNCANRRASCEKRVRPSFCLRRRGERGSADGKQRSQDGSDRHRRRGAGDAGVHGACLPVMRASTREEMRRISFTSRSSSRLFLIHSR